MAGTETAPDTDPHGEAAVAPPARPHTGSAKWYAGQSWKVSTEKKKKKSMNLARKTHLGLGGTSPIFIRTPPEWPRDTAEVQTKNTHTHSIRWFV